jgi:hypothetical protein
MQILPCSVPRQCSGTLVVFLTVLRVSGERGMAPAGTSCRCPVEFSMHRVALPRERRCGGVLASSTGSDEFDSLTAALYDDHCLIRSAKSRRCRLETEVVACVVLNPPDFAGRRGRGGRARDTASRTCDARPRASPPARDRPDAVAACSWHLWRYHPACVRASLNHVLLGNGDRAGDARWSPRISRRHCRRR